MILTVNQALKKLCPMGVSYPSGDVPCAGDNCMAWRWAFSFKDKNGSLVRVGYCGLGGDPRIMIEE